MYLITFLIVHFNSLKSVKCGIFCLLIVGQSYRILNLVTDSSVWLWHITIWVNNCIKDEVTWNIELQKHEWGRLKSLEPSKVLVWNAWVTLKHVIEEWQYEHWQKHGKPLDLVLNIRKYKTKHLSQLNVCSKVCKSECIHHYRGIQFTRTCNKTKQTWTCWGVRKI